MREAVIVEAVRSPVRKKGGSLSGWHPVDLLAGVLKAAAERSGLDPAGVYDIVIASGVEHMTRVPMGITAQRGPGFPFPPSLMDRYEGGLVPQGVSAEIIAERWGLLRQELDEFGARSHELAHAATEEGRFQREILPIKVEGETGSMLFERDEGIRFPVNREKMAALPTPFKDGGMVTAGNSSQISDGAAALVIAGRDTAEAFGLRPRARFHAFALSGVDPITMLTGPIPATEKVLSNSGLRLEDIDVVEINEAFASVVLAWKKELGVGDRWFEGHVNPNGGAIALGHPLGATGAKLMTTLLHELERRDARWGLQVMCEGGGEANATVIERLR